jgi:O-antigen/teichoic acid export membrane protein
VSTSTTSPTRGLRGPIGWTVGGNLVYTLSQWACVAVIARALGPADVGVFALAGAVAAPVLVLTQLQLRIVLATDVRHSHRLGDFLVVRSWSAVVLVAVVAAAGLVVGGREALPVIAVFGLAKAFDSVADVLYGYHQRREEMRAIALGQGVNGILSVVLLATAIWTTGSLLAGVAGFALGSALNLALRVVPAMRASRAADADDPRDQPSGRGRLVRLAAPLAGVLLLGSVASSVPRIVLEDVAGSYALGIFAGVAYVVLAAANLVNAVGNALSPRLARAHADGDRAGFTRLLGFGILFGAGLALLGALLSWVVGDEVLALLYGPEYGAAGGLLAAMCLVSVVAFTGSFLVGAATAARRFREQLPVAVLTCAAAVVVSLLAVPRWGVEGAVAATAAVAVVQVVGYAVVLRRVLGAPDGAR